MKSMLKSSLSYNERHTFEENEQIMRNTRRRDNQIGTSDPNLSNIVEKQLSPPLPLMKFKFPSNKAVEVVKTLTGETLRNVDNKFPSHMDNRSRDRLFDPVYARKLVKYFTARSHKENNIKQLQDIACDDVSEKADLYEYCVYESFLHSETSKERSFRNSERKTEDAYQQERFDFVAQSFLHSAGCMGSAASRTVSLSSIGDASNQNQQNQILSGSSSKPPTPVSSRMSPSLGKPSFTKSLQFDGEFECGNIEKAKRVFGRETLLNSCTTSRGCDTTSDFVSPLDVDQEYDITLRKDVNTEGNIQWYYFSATAGEDTFSTVSGGTAMSFPLKVRFNLVNMQKKDSLYNYGMKPAIYSVNQVNNEDWIHGGDDICYYRNGLTAVKTVTNNSIGEANSSKKKTTVVYYSTLTFTYVFTSPDTVFFAHTFPYSYTDLQYYLNYLESDARISTLVHRRPLCKTLAGNNCDILSITERSTGVVEGKIKPSIVVSARVHPGKCLSRSSMCLSRNSGEANSSYVVHGLIEFLTGESPEALKLRKSFIFHIVPMLNPDGVVHGNYRCSLAGTDLNRRFLDTHKSLHPTVAALKNFIQSIQQQRHVLMYLDLHGHSKMKNCFLYGCDVTQQPEKLGR